MKLNSQQKALDTRLYDKKIFVFDWDGTILDSMYMKSKNFDFAFRSLVEVEPTSNPIEGIVEHYLRLSGRPRKHIFIEILKLLELGTGEVSFEDFNATFEALNKRTLIHAEAFADALELLRELIRLKHGIFISSSVPQKELIELVKAILPVSIRDGISSILGSEDGFSKGVGHLGWIMKETGATRDRLLVIGDDLADFELSLEAGVDCILVDRTGTMKGNSNNTVSDLILIKESL